MNSPNMKNVIVEAGLGLSNLTLLEVSGNEQFNQTPLDTMFSSLSNTASTVRAPLLTKEMYLPRAPENNVFSQKGI